MLLGFQSLIKELINPSLIKANFDTLVLKFQALIQFSAKGDTLKV
jgi:hypothetical protein